MTAVIPPERNAPVAASCRTGSQLLLEPLFAVAWFEQCSFRQRLFQRPEDAWSFAAKLSATFDPRTGTLAEFVDRVWLPWRLETVSRATWTRQAKLLRRSILPSLGETRLRDLQLGQVLTYLEHERLRGLSLPYMKLHWTTLRSLLHLARSYDLVQLPEL